MASDVSDAVKAHLAGFAPHIAHALAEMIASGHVDVFELSRLGFNPADCQRIADILDPHRHRRDDRPHKLE